MERVGQAAGPWELDGEFAPRHGWPRAWDSLPTRLSAPKRELRLRGPAPPREPPTQPARLPGHAAAGELAPGPTHCLLPRPYLT